MKTLLCQHSAPPATGITVCKHTLELKDTGIKFFTGDRQNADYRCLDCNKSNEYEKFDVCIKCLDTIEKDGDWYVSGFPEIKKTPQPFKFTRREIVFPAIRACKVMASKPLNRHASKMLIFTSTGQLLLADIVRGETVLQTEISGELVDRQGAIDICISLDDKYVVISSAVQKSVDVSPSNKGVVLELASGKVIIELDCGEYHTELTPFPVTFLEYKGKTLVVHATDWNKLDITDPVNLKKLTERNLDDIPEQAEDSDGIFTEWYGALKVSPDQQRIATIGWVWHPMGVAFSFDVKRWLDGSKWEAEYGISRKSYTIWDYFWDSPFVWLDNGRLCIWGAEGGQPSNSNPPDCIAIYDAESEKLLQYFPGPTEDIFFYDSFLFSGIQNGEGITVWSIEEGSLLHTEEGITAMDYHPGRKEFLDFSDDGKVIIHKWEKQE